jgi:hypothetical protein
VILLLGLGKKRIELEQFCRLVHLRLYEKHPMEMDLLDIYKVLTNEEYKRLNEELFIYRFVAFNVLLLRHALMRKSKINLERLGAIGSNSLKFVLKEKRINQKRIDEIFDTFIKQLGFQMGVFSTLGIPKQKNIYDAEVSFGITKYFCDLFGYEFSLKPNGELNMTNAQEVFLMKSSLQVYKMVEQMFQEEQANYKILDL